MIIDANIITGYYQECVLGRETNLSGSTEFINDLTYKNPFYLDTNHVIESEWSNCNRQEWFNAWLAEVLGNGTARYINPVACPKLKPLLKKHGFPIGRDICYIRTAIAVQRQNDDATIKTEDLDFYDPKKKQIVHGKTRNKLLKNRNAPVKKMLAKKYNITVSPLCD